VVGDLQCVLSLRALFPDRHPLTSAWRYLRPRLFGQIASDAAWIADHYEYADGFYMRFLDRRHRCYSQAVFASDVYSVGVTMYQMLTGSLPYDTPAPSDLARLATGELVTAPRLKNPKIPKAINDIVLRALAPDPTARYQRAADVLNDILAFRDTPLRPLRRARTAGVATAEDRVSEIQSRLKARETPQASFCWHCRKPLQARTAKCPFCNEAQ
jgi:serine/threonine protein kinase